MEKTSVTIEIRQEVSITLLWIVTGVVLVIGVSLLAPHSPELWTLINYAGLAVVLYLFALLTYALRKPLPLSTRLWMGTCAIVVMCSMGFTWIRMESQTRWQAETLMRIRGVIARGILRNEVSAAALKALDEFYQEGPNTKKTLADVFREQHQGVTVGSDIHKREWDRDSLQVVVTRLDPDRIEVISKETYVPGKDPSFDNLNGRYGMVQERFILTTRGITHVIEN